jgi:hypothetical protein
MDYAPSTAVLGLCTNLTIGDLPNACGVQCHLPLKPQVFKVRLTFKTGMRMCLFHFEEIRMN